MTRDARLDAFLDDAFAGTLIATIPTVLVFVFLQRNFIQGLTMGSGK